MEETTSRNLESTQEIMTSDDNSSEPDQATSVNIRMNDAALKEIMSLMFGDVCSLQEGRVLGSLMLALVNQMARGLVFVEQYFLVSSHWKHVHVFFFLSVVIVFGSKVESEQLGNYPSPLNGQQPTYKKLGLELGLVGGRGATRCAVAPILTLILVF